MPLMSCTAMLVVLAFLPAAAQSGDTARLSLAECLDAALTNNLDLVSARLDPAIAEQQIEQTMAPFDGAVDAGASYNDSDGDETIRDNVSLIQDTGKSESEVLNGDVSFNHLLQYGGSYSLRYDLGDVDFASTSVQAATGFLTRSIFEQETEGFTLSYDMPLLNGFGKEVNTINILLARSGLETSREDLRLQAMQTVQAVEDAYWNVLAAKEAVRIARLALQRAEDLLELNKKKVEVGTLAPIEITEAEAGVAAQVETVIVRETTLEDAEDVLLQLMAVPQNDMLWVQSIDPVDRPSWDEIQVDLDSAITTALDQRPEMSTARQALRDNELSERVAKKNTRHGLNLNASIAPDQHDDTDRLVETLSPPGIQPSDTTTNSEDTNWSIGLRYTYSFRNRAAKADYAIAKHTTEKSDIALRNLEQTIRVDVRRAVRNVESGKQRIRAARKNTELQQEKLNAEEKKYDNGMSTSFEVLTFQNDLADAELRQIQAGLDYAKSLTALELAKGTLLEARGLRLD
jgi:outer membrane protein TolC